MVNIELKGGVVKEFDDGITAMEVAKSLGMGLYKAACVCRIDGEVKDLRTPINKDCKLEILTFDDDDGKRALRHTASHVLAQAVKRLYPEAKLAIGPAIDNGFYYDFDVDVPFTPEVLEKIEAEMKKIENCLHCNQCKSKCPYGLDTPKLLEENYKDYVEILNGKEF